VSHDDTGRPDFKALALSALSILTDAERCNVMGNFCGYCGCKQPWHPDNPDFAADGLPCQCWNDE
jgi:hypothetical protein